MRLNLLDHLSVLVAQLRIGAALGVKLSMRIIVPVLDLFLLLVTAWADVVPRDRQPVRQTVVVQDRLVRLIMVPVRVECHVRTLVDVVLRPIRLTVQINWVVAPVHGIQDGWIAKESQTLV